MENELHATLIDELNNIVMKIISPREEQVLHLIADENTNNEIAGKLYISLATVNTHRKNLCLKLDARNTAGLIRRAFEHGILQLNLRQPELQNQH